MPPLLLLPVLLFLAAADAYPASCRNATCGSTTIAYPFWLNSSAASDCGYPGLGLLCEDTTLFLPVRHNRYKVLNIDYGSHTISLSDVAASITPCPRLHLNLTIDIANSGLQLTPSDSNITFLYNCKKNASSPSAAELCGCPSEPECNQSSYVLSDDGLLGEVYEYECEEVVVAPVLDAHKKVMSRGEYGGPPAANWSLGDVLSGGFEMRYNPHTEQCGRCERSSGWCGYRRNQTDGGMGFICFCGDGPTTEHCDSGSGKKNWTAIVADIIASTLSVLLLCLIFSTILLGYKKYRSKKISKETPRIESFLQKNVTLHPKRYTYAQVKRITKSFAEKLGQGGFGVVYRGDLSDGRQIAVKMLKDSEPDGEEFINEVPCLHRP